MFSSCQSSKSEMVYRAKQNLEASLDYPKQLKVIAHTQTRFCFWCHLFYKKRNNWDAEGNGCCNKAIDGKD